MAERFDWVPLPVWSPPEKVIQSINRMAQRVKTVLSGLRRESDRLVSKQNLEVDKAGGGLIVCTPDGANRYRIGVDNTGAITATLL